DWSVHVGGSARSRSEPALADGAGCGFHILFKGVGVGQRLREKPSVVPGFSESAPGFESSRALNLFKSCPDSPENQVQLLSLRPRRRGGERAAPRSPAPGARAITKRGSQEKSGMTALAFRCRIYERGIYDHGPRSTAGATDSDRHAGEHRAVCGRGRKIRPNTGAQSGEYFVSRPL